MSYVILDLKLQLANLRVLALLLRNKEHDITADLTKNKNKNASKLTLETFIVLCLVSFFLVSLETRENFPGEFSNFGNSGIFLNQN